MKLHLLDRKGHSNAAFMMDRHHDSHFLKIWHYHPELELVYILKSTGTRFVGDSIEKFEPGQLVLLGKNLPHMWLNDDLYFEEDSDLESEALAIHFRIDFLGDTFFDVFEFLAIKQLLHRAQRGVLFLGIADEVTDKLWQLYESEGAERVIKFISLLDLLSKWEDSRCLSSDGFMQSFENKSAKHLDKVYEYLYNNFHKKILLKEAAAIAGMNPSAFSRSFKKIHNKTFIRYLNEIRIAYACRLLIEGGVKISAISYDCGFNNLSNFNRQFKLIRGVSPTEYQDQYKY